MPVIAIRSEYRCKICRSPNRYEIDELLGERNKLSGAARKPSWHWSQFKDRLVELGIQNPTPQNVTTHWQGHCRELDEATDQEIAMASGDAARELAAQMQTLAPDADNLLDTALKIGHMRWQHELAKGEVPKFTPEQIRAFIDAKTRRKSNEQTGRLIDIQVEAMTRSLSEAVVEAPPAKAIEK